MKLTTQHLGELEYEEVDVIHFDDAIPGFEELHKYIIIPSGDAELPFHYLQSVEEADLAFIVTDPFLFVENYDFELPDADAEKLGVASEADAEKLIVYAIATIPENVDDTTINIVAPILINIESKKGIQLVLNEYDAFKHPIFKKEEA
ncbi:flagellar assembly protein FliW [Fusibacter tunisiensis]|uniref:Flagellar assembly factor FliW n=1 Tax=Fusibacter tunisiensis TaxID=1008308 RepID=A0ABS2MPK1_9FIRM|nr:flagellar assembly protein FliW [Fusibacter tunisiensis]MBM7561323.1 flagellar assembly factor FliW [Fusibacter tunisiensis]